MNMPNTSISKVGGKETPYETIKFEERDFIEFFNRNETDVYPTPKYAIATEDGTELFPLWLTSMRAIEQVKSTICHRTRYYGEKYDIDTLKIVPISEEFAKYYEAMANAYSKGESFGHDYDKYPLSSVFPTHAWTGYYACPHCGHIATTIEFRKNKKTTAETVAMYGDKACMVEELVGGQEKHKNCCPNCRKDIEQTPIGIRGTMCSGRSATIFYDGDKIIISGFVTEFIVNRKANKLVMKAYRTRAVYNTKTGQSFVLPTFTAEGKKAKGKTMYNHIVNVTYTGIYDGGISYYVLQNPTVKKRILEALLQAHGREYNEKWENILAISDLGTIMACFSIFNRFPMMREEDIEVLAKNYRLIKNDMSKTFGAICPTDEQMNVIAKIKTRLPKTKTFKKLVARDILNALKMETFRAYGFSKVDLLERFCAIEDKDIVFNNYYYEKVERANKCKFLRQLIKSRGEVVTMGLLQSQHAHLLMDTAYMYIKILPHGVLTNDDLKGNLKEIHDRLANIEANIRHANVEIPYSPKEKTLEGEFDGIVFKLAADTHTLIRVGQQMHICVGSYDERAMLKSCTIVVGYKDEKPVICIELSGTSKNLVQAKAFANNLVQGNNALALKKWVESNGIDADSNCDYKHIKAGNILFDETQFIKSNHDYHGLEVDENGNVYEGRGHLNNLNLFEPDEEVGPFFEVNGEDELLF